jgi:hypothetical protein
MDTLDLVADAGRDLLSRVDAALLAAGTPAGHPVRGLLRRAGALPGDAFRSVVALRPSPLLAAAAELRGLAAGHARRHAGLAAPVDWAGAGAQAYTVRRDALARYLGQGLDAGEDSAAGRLLATAGYLDAVAEWVDGSRRAVAGAVAAALSSAEAVRLRAGGAALVGAATGSSGAVTPAAGTWSGSTGVAGPGVAGAGVAGPGAAGPAAADVAAHVLATVVERLERGAELADAWRDRLGELPYRPPAGGPPAAGGAAHVPL